MAEWTFYSNKKTQKNISDYGVRVARPGYDAGFCAQNQLLFNSNWPILQICSVMKVSSMPIVWGYEVLETETKYNSQTYELISYKETTYQVSSIPSGYTSTYSESWSSSSVDSLELVRANKKYIEVLIDGTRTYYYYPDQTTTSGGITTIKTKQCTYYSRKRKSHKLGYTPFFLRSEDVSSTSGYVVLFSVDITTDVDYPYTEEPLAMLTPTVDYGIKSSSIFPKVDGLCSNMFSKLVQAVKTEKTIDNTSAGADIEAVWSPVKRKSDAKRGCLLPFEFYAFCSDGTDGAGIDGGNYYHRSYTRYLPSGYGDTAEDAWAATSGSEQTTTIYKNSLVVLRSPMVSPEYEERTVS